MCFKMTIQCGGLIQTRDYWPYYHWDYAKSSEEIQTFFTAICNSPFFAVDYDKMVDSFIMEGNLVFFKGFSQNSDKHT